MANDPSSHRFLRFDAMLTAVSPQKVDLLKPAFVEIDANGKIISYQNEAPAHQEQFVSYPGMLVPAFINAHSHAFQYALAGHTEFRSAQGGTDNFWTWRQVMYQVADRMSPELLLPVATALYTDLARNGYQHVHEFHYLHHQKGGKAYAPSVAMAEALFEAAKLANIDLTILPVFYKHGGFNQAPNAEQKRFVSQDAEAYLRLWDETKQAAQRVNPQIRVGVAFHSLRAVSPDDIRQVHNALKGQTSEFHIHIAEQTKEVDDCLQVYGRRPIELLSETIDLDSSWNLVHATHSSPAELQRIANSKCRVVICPSTEANLGDGVFPLAKALDLGIAFAIGSDSHVATDPWSELQLLEYLNRATDRARNIAARSPGAYSALSLLQKVWDHQILGQSFWQRGSFLNGILLKTDHPYLEGQTTEEILTSTMFSSLVSAKRPDLKMTFYRGLCLNQDEAAPKNSQNDEALRSALRTLYKS